MKNIIDEWKGGSVVIRRALDSVKNAGAKLYKRAALTDFDLCINFEYSTKVLIPPSNTNIPAEIPSKLARTGAIFDTPEICAVFKDAHNEKALFRISEIFRYSNQTLKYIRNCINEKQEQLKMKGKNNEQLRKKIEDCIEDWMEAREWYKTMYKATQKIIDHKKKLKPGDKHKSGVKIN
ncbi:hypothetical protein Hanom_Chr16g01457811 [Helianthus anomalus]